MLEALLAAPLGINEAIRPQAEGGLPALGGLYAWWARRDSLPDVPQRPHPSCTNVDLFYVGISPVRSGSSATLRKRVIGNHILGNIGGSTFRFTLAALLVQELDLSPIHPSDRPLLTRQDNAQLADWQRRNLTLTWCVRAEPWADEPDVIAELQPPLNLARNSSHPFHTTLSAARVRFRQLARG